MTVHARKNHVSVRLEPDVIERIDRLIPRFSTERRKGTRSVVVRALILAGLDHQPRAEPAEPAVLVIAGDLPAKRAR